MGVRVGHYKRHTESLYRDYHLGNPLSFSFLNLYLYEKLSGESSLASGRVLRSSPGSDFMFIYVFCTFIYGGGRRWVIRFQRGLELK